MRNVIALILIIFSSLSLAEAQVYSELWGKNGELWKGAAKKHLLDHTGAGYMNGDVPLPDWPVGVTVTDFGAIPNDDLDDSEAFNKAIQSCPEFKAVFVPNGTWVIKGQIKAGKENVAVRGEHMYDTVLYMPEYTSVLPEATQYTAWVEVSGNNSGVENLTLKLREQPKGGHWEGMKGGAHPLSLSGKNLWARNINILNGDNALIISGSHNTAVNIILDQYLGRNSGYVGHMGVVMNGGHSCLVHNAIIYGRWHHALCTVNSADDNVWSQVRMENGEIDHHSAGGRRQLFTDIDAGEGWLLFEQDMSDQKPEIYWNLKSKEVDWPYGYSRGYIVTPELFDVQITIVAMNTPNPSNAKLSNEYWYESLDPYQIHPQNIYLAQMEKAGKPLPNYPMPAPPAPPSDEPFVLTPTDDCKMSEGLKQYADREKIKKEPSREIPKKLIDRDNLINTVGKGSQLNMKAINGTAYLKFDLSDIPFSEIRSAKLRVFLSKGRLQNLEVFEVTDDSWEEHIINWTNKPVPGPNVIGSVPEATAGEWAEVDITPFIIKEFRGDKRASMVLSTKGGGGILNSREAGNGPQLIIEPPERQ